MLLPASLLSLLCTASAFSIFPLPHQQQQRQQQHLFSNPPEHHAADYHIPSIHESTVMARRILYLSSIGTLVTSFPETEHSSSSDVETQERRPPGVEGTPIGLMEYYADCERNGNPTLLAIDIATSYKNYRAGSNVSLAVRWWPRQATSYHTHDSNPYARAFFEEEIPTPRTPAALPRFSLHGYLETMSEAELAENAVPGCFLDAHPDSILWQPGNDISHESEYVRFVVEYVYWFGGFGDRARIGWLPIEEWRSVTLEEVQACRLPGEEGEKEGERKAGL